LKVCIEPRNELSGRKL